MSSTRSEPASQLGAQQGTIVTAENSPVFSHRMNQLNLRRFAAVTAYDTSSWRHPEVATPTHASAPTFLSNTIKKLSSPVVEIGGIQGRYAKVLRNSIGAAVYLKQCSRVHLH